MSENWGYNKLAGYIKKQSIGEMKHAEVLIERILFLDGTPSMEPVRRWERPAHDCERLGT
jgi:bacterioferritin